MKSLRNPHEHSAKLKRSQYAINTKFRFPVCVGDILAKRHFDDLAVNLPCDMLALLKYHDVSNHDVIKAYSGKLAAFVACGGIYRRTVQERF